MKINAPFFRMCVIECKIGKNLLIENVFAFLRVQFGAVTVEVKFRKVFETIYYF